MVALRATITLTNIPVMTPGLYDTFPAPQSNEAKETRHEPEAEALARGLAMPMPSLEAFLRQQIPSV